MNTITRDVYTFDELDDSAKEKAREWWREGENELEWWDFVYEDFLRICEVLGVEIDVTRNNQTGKENGKKIYFSGFCYQGDGASFEGAYRYKKGSSKAIREYAPKDEELHRIADTLRDIQRTAFYNAIVGIRQSGNYYHRYTMSFEVESYDEWTFPWSYEFCDKLTDEFDEPLRDLAHWLYKTLENEYEWLNADEQVDDNIRANEYQFTECGSRSFTI